MPAIYTRTGDHGKTRLRNGKVVYKNDPRVQYMGEKDELNSVIGLVLSEKIPEHLQNILTEVQCDLFNLEEISSRRALWLEREMSRLDSELEPVKHFILPGGTSAAATCHLARTVCRRLERVMVALVKKEEVSSTSLVFINRLSDMLFMVARSLNAAAERKETLWCSEDAKQSGNS